MDKHNFNPGPGDLCIMPGCYLPKSDAIHNFEHKTNAMDIFDAIKVSKVSMCAKCNHPELLHNAKGCEHDGCKCGHNDATASLAEQLAHDGTHTPGTYTPPLECTGHLCPTCSTVWRHDYVCKLPADSSILCETCARESTVIINRQKNLEYVMRDGKGPLSGKEIVEIMMEHEWFLKLELDKLPDATAKLDFIMQHRADLSKKIQALRSRELATSKVMAKMQMDEITKLTPEEREQFERDARRNKPSRATARVKSKSPEEVKKAQQDAYQKLLKELIKQQGGSLSEAESILKKAKN